MGNRARLAVILAAGSGSRLKNTVKDFPKGFLKLGNEPIIEESLRKLLDCGIRRVIIVAGFLGDFYRKLSQGYPCIHVVYNDRYADSGSMFSLFCAKDFINEDFLLLESDLIYEQKALEAVQSFSKDNCILLSGKTGSGDEVFAEVVNGKVKHLSKNRNELGSVSGELVGISRISKSLFKMMIKESEELFKESIKFEYDTGCLALLANKTEVYSNKIDGLLWAEIDDEGHLKRAKEMIYPKILASEKKFV